jgi:uncharacterized membrane protein YhhN
MARTMRFVTNESRTSRTCLETRYRSVGIRSLADAGFFRRTRVAKHITYLVPIGLCAICAGHVLTEDEDSNAMFRDIALAFAKRRS